MVEARLAILLLTSSLLIAPPSCQAGHSPGELYRRGVAEARGGNYQKAARIFRHILLEQKATATTSERMRAARALSSVYRRLGRGEAARKCLVHARKIASASPTGTADSLNDAIRTVHTTVSNLDVGQPASADALARAAAVFARALEDGRDVPTAHYGLGVCLALSDEADAARATAHLEKSLAGGYTHPNVFAMLAGLARRQGNATREIFYLDESLRHGNSSPVLYAALARAYGARNEPGDGEQVEAAVRSLLQHGTARAGGIVESVADLATRERVAGLIADKLRQERDVARVERERTWQMAQQPRPVAANDEPEPPPTQSPARSNGGPRSNNTTAGRASTGGRNNGRRTSYLSHSSGYNSVSVSVTPR